MDFTKNEITRATEPTAIRAWAEGRMIFIELTDGKNGEKTGSGKIFAPSYLLRFYLLLAAGNWTSAAL